MDSQLLDCLGRWVAAGLITDDQAERIAAAEAVLAPVSRRRALVAEALGYLGAALTLVASFATVELLWPGIPTGAQLACAAAGALALFLIGIAVPAGEDPAFRRLRCVLWFGSTTCVAAFAGLLGDQVWRLGTDATWLLASSAAAPYATYLWWRTRATPQHLAAFTLAALAVESALSLLVADSAWAGLALWLLAALWAAATQAHRLPPVPAGHLAAALGALIGAQLTLHHAAGHVLALLTVGGILALGVATRTTLLLVLGALGAALFVPQTATRFLPGTVTTPVAILAVGLILLATALRLTRRDRSARPSA